MLTEETVIDRIEIDERGNVAVRRASFILRDGVRLSPMYHRTVYEPGADLNAEASIVKAIAALVWTPDVIDTAIRHREAALAALVTPPEAQGGTAP